MNIKQSCKYLSKETPIPTFFDKSDPTRQRPLHICQATHPPPHPTFL